MCADYKQTLNFPETSFPMQADLLARQEETLRRWQAQDIYRSILEERRDAEPYVLHDGPPYAAGLVHVGIGMNKVLKDIVAKYRSMNDRRVPFVPGWDCHGLPIEMEVRKELGDGAATTGAQEIRRRCAESALRYVQEQKREFQLLGIFADWDHPYLTMSPGYEAGVLSVLLDLVEKGYVYRGLRPLAWCSTCGTALADAEVEQREEDGLRRCTRCDDRVETRETEQWFVRLDHRERAEGRTLRESVLVEIEILQWIPAASRKRMRDMVEHRPDWCISRQRFWGVPIPAFVCRACGESNLLPAAIRAVRDLVAEHGSSVWFEKSAADLLPAGVACSKCRGTDFDKGADILDVWFESGASWQALLIADHRLGFPADLLVEGTDQHRGWFQLSLLTAVASAGKAPMRSVLTHGFVLNEQRMRMSRSRGDRTSLAEALERHPADILRLFFASSDVSGDIALPTSYEPVEAMYRTFRNTFRFLLANLNGFLPREHSVHLDDLEPLDLWALCRLHHLIAKAGEEYDAFRFHAAIRKLTEFCEDLSRIFFDPIKDRLYYEAPTSPTRRSALTTLHSILMGLVKLLAPVLPYTCEEVWALTPGHSSCASVHLSRWPRADGVLLQRHRSQEAEKAIERFRALRSALGPALEDLRTRKLIGKNEEARVLLHVETGLSSFLTIESRDGLRRFLRVAEVVEAPPAGLFPATDVAGVFYAVEVARHQRCARCERPDATRGSVPHHPDLCARCAEVLDQKSQVAFVDTARNGAVSPGMRPADLAQFLRARDIRKLAILNEDGKCQALALDPASREVRALGELESLATYVNASADFRDHAALLLGLGAHTDTLFGIGIHHLNYGTPLGGTREKSYDRTSDLLDELLRLSWGMSLKNAVAELPHGGGKSIIETCGLDLFVHRELRRDIYRDFGQFTASLFGRYICAEDMNNTTADTREMLSACRHVMCLPQGVSGSGNPSRFTALAAWAAAKAGWKFLTGTTSFAKLTIAVQGAGNVGRNIVAILIEADPDIGRIVMADRDPEQIQLIRSLLLKRGKEGILQVASSKDPADDSGSYDERADERGLGYVLHLPCDILIPAAVGKVINQVNVGKLQCRLILPIANNVYSDNDSVAEALFARGIVDVVENNVNWGGAMAAASELLGYDEQNVAIACLEAFDKTYRLLQDARTRHCPPWQIVKERATHRIFRETHPAVAAARRYKFIGDVSASFAEWIKNKWLRSVVDVDEDHFARYAVGLMHR
jgi:isoleucyl-tRNA synthetase/glutamate dehydrogenase/leucine dehydrogenase